MSNPFGVPPPPRPQVMEPGTTRVVMGPDDFARPRGPDPERWRKRGVVALAACAVAALLLADIGVWVHFRVLAPRAAAAAVAPATIGDVRPTITAGLITSVRSDFDNAAAKALSARGPRAVTAAVNSSGPRIERHVQALVASPQFAAAWQHAVVITVANQHALAHGHDVVDQATVNGTTLQLDLQPFAATLAKQFQADGYTFVTPATFSLGTYTLDASASASDQRALLSLTDTFWWLFVLLALGFGGAAFWFATRRIRLGFFMAIDVVVVLAIVLILVAGGSAVAGDQTSDPVGSVALAHAYHAITRPLVTQTVVLMVLALCTAIGLGVYSADRRRASRADFAA